MRDVRVVVQKLKRGVLLYFKDLGYSVKVTSIDERSSRTIAEKLGIEEHEAATVIANALEVAEEKPREFSLSELMEQGQDDIASIVEELRRKALRGNRIMCAVAVGEDGPIFVPYDDKLDIGTVITTNGKYYVVLGRCMARPTTDSFEVAGRMDSAQLIKELHPHALTVDEALAQNARMGLFVVSFDRERTRELEHGIIMRGRSGRWVSVIFSKDQGTPKSDAALVFGRLRQRNRNGRTYTDILAYGWIEL